MEAYEILGEMLRALHEAFPGTEGKWESSIGKSAVAKRSWDKGGFHFHLLLTYSKENKFEATLEIGISTRNPWPMEFKEAIAKRPTPAEAIAEVVARWRNNCDPTVFVPTAAPAPVVADAAADAPAKAEGDAAEVATEGDPWENNQ